MLRLTSVFSLLIMSCSSGSNHTPPLPVIAPSSSPPLLELNTPLEVSPETRARMDAMISIFENSTPDIQYDYIENIGDGRGYTAGRAGFTSSTGDLLEVIEAYDEIISGGKQGASLFSEFVPRLKQLQASGDGSTKDLEGLPAAWKAASKDPDFRRAQDEVVDRDYYFPAIQLAKAHQIHTPLGYFIVYDAFIQQGSGTTPDCVEADFQSTDAYQNEKQYLTSFLNAREQILLHSGKKWKETVVRLEVMRSLLDQNNFDLNGPIDFNLYEEDFHLQ